jgi:Zn-dependent M28 family amino/carboxypeptidase
MRRVRILIVLLLLAAACGPSDVPFDGEEAYAHVQAQLEFGYRPTGSLASIVTGDYIIGELESLGWVVELQEFEYLGTPGRNIIAHHPAQSGEAPLMILGAHYDTRRSADQDDPLIPVLGANDGGSGVAVLLELARTLDLSKVDYRIWLAFFDAEDNGGLDGWQWIVGSSYMAASLRGDVAADISGLDSWELIMNPPHTAVSLEIDVAAVIVVDMVGDVDQQFWLERNSDSDLQQRLWDIAAELGYGEHFVSEVRWTILDDHIPFARLGIPAVDIIDFDYPYWHTTEDTLDKVSAESLERVGRVLEEFLEQGYGW